MKRLVLFLLSLLAIHTAMAQSSWENLSRGLVAIKNGNKTFVSWRVHATDAPDVTFDLLRNGTVVKSGLTVSNAELSTYVAGARYQVVARLQGEEQDRSEEVTAWDNIYTTLKLDCPASQADYHYFPNDCSVADLDGDGQYEIVVKWDPSNNQDNWMPTR